MSTATLTGLRDYLYDTLSPANMIWLGQQLMEHGHQKEEPSMKRYTIEDLHAMLDLSEADFAAGRFIDDDDAWADLDEELAREQQKLAEAV